MKSPARIKVEGVLYDATDWLSVGQVAVLADCRYRTAHKHLRDLAFKELAEEVTQAGRQPIYRMSREGRRIFESRAAA
jgi:hypothetical protein